MPFKIKKIRDDKGIDLTDLSAVAPISYNNSTGEFTFDGLTFGGLTDVTLTSPANGELVHYNDTSGDWENFNIFNTANTWTADQTFNEEMHGVPRTLECSLLGSVQFLTENTTHYLKIGEVTMRSDKGITAKNDGSIIGVTLDYDVTSLGVPVWIEVLVQGIVVISSILTLSSSDNLVHVFRQARDIDTFEESDTISVRLRGGQTGSESPVNMNDIICTLDIVYDTPP